MNLRLLIERLLALSKREVKVRVSYRMSVLTGVVGTVAGLLVYGLLGNSAVVSVTSTAYGMSLASYLVSGVAFSPIVTNGLGMFAEYTSPGQVEEVMVTPTGFREFVLLSSCLSILIGLGSVALSFGAGIFLFGLSYSYNAPVLVAVVVLGLVSSVGLGFLGLGFQLVYKQTAILSWLLYAFTGLVGNMLVPVEVLPATVRTVSYLTPQYYFFTGVRVALGSDVAPLGSLLALFALYTIILVGVGLVVLNRGLKFVKRNGTHRWT